MHSMTSCSIACAFTCRRFLDNSGSSILPWASSPLCMLPRLCRVPPRLRFQASAKKQDMFHPPFAGLPKPAFHMGYCAHTSSYMFLKTKDLPDGSQGGYDDLTLIHTLLCNVSMSHMFQSHTSRHNDSRSCFSDTSAQFHMKCIPFFFTTFDESNGTYPGSSRIGPSPSGEI